MAKATHLNRPYEAVTVVLSNYFDALYESDAAKLSRVFHPLAHYVCVSDGTLHRFLRERGSPFPSQCQLRLSDL